MNLKHIAAAAALLAASASSFAVTNLGTLNPSATFGNVVTGAFADEYSFSLSSDSIVAASATNVSVNFMNMSWGGINGFEMELATAPVFGPQQSSAPAAPFTINTQTINGNATLSAGLYVLKIKGTGVTGANASYGGAIVAAPLPQLPPPPPNLQPVPEPETYAMMIAGLAAVGFVARRRKAAK